ncbi:hypothetical protein SAMN04488535_1175 [Corynebacterium mycetoides]|uniref:Uncharacterized protein n=1 Tax=Corynebacterium mycetoides TaxID=38302 RepID=A0A1G9NUK6_9CORY|nr:hypothetical protein [Corynebacterium mycetoides]SDL89993.1 hypothetical protein SAMN04488535_1175 [Corynebacterium mycetoides]
MSTSLAALFPPILWDPIINVLTSILGPLAQSSAPLSALASSAAGLF